MYQQELGRFMSRDPLSPDGVSVLYPVPDMREFSHQRSYENPYAYVRNSPMNAVDPSGNIPMPAQTKPFVTVEGNVITGIGEASELDDWLNFGRCFPPGRHRVFYIRGDWYTAEAIVPAGTEPCTKTYRVMNCLYEVTGRRRCSKKVEITFQEDTKIKVKCDCWRHILQDPTGSRFGHPGRLYLLLVCRWKVVDFDGPKAMRKEYKKTCGECVTPLDRPISPWQVG